MTIDKDVSSTNKPIDWERYGLCSEPASEQGPLLGSWGEREGSSHFHDRGAKEELFQENELANSKPWWKANFFLSEPVLFGVWDGVFTSCMINLFSVIIFLRVGWIVGNAGVVQSVGIVIITVLIGITTVLSGIGICDRCHLERGGVNFLLSHIFGARTGGAISLIYCFGQSVSCALHVMGFAESFSQVVAITDAWATRGVAVGMITLLLAINLAGVKWVVRLQFGLLILLLLSALDFAVGTFIQVDFVHGVVGYDLANLKNNTGPDYNDGENWFTVFGVFFPAMTGILAGINMSGDLHNPSKDIPTGTLASVGTSFFIYMMFVVGLGATCQRWALHTDYMIAEKVSAIGVLFLAGLYISAMSACLGALYATPRIIQSMANENVIPLLRFLGKGKGPNKVPIYSLILFASVTFIFVLIGSINTLAPIVTIPFLFTYASVEYAYFSLAMSFDIQRKREERYSEQKVQSPSFVVDLNHKRAYGSAKTDADLDELFPERVPHHKRGLVREGSSMSLSPTDSPLTSPDEHSSVRSVDSLNSQICVTQPAAKTPGEAEYYRNEITSKQKRWYTIFCNRWLALFGACVKIAMMFLVQWIYAFAAFAVLLLLWFYIGQVNPGNFRGIAEFRLFPWLKNLFYLCLGCKIINYDQIVVAPILPEMEVKEAQLTEDNADFASRKRYHHSKTIESVPPADGLQND
ncbi:solute carrier family 12 member 8 [Parasteatoda tepidariorum]|uniref:solute carrier family 12 member 8 n=1 Tax=Parasteatoda tepidariorum TaxID=114398 RepID=UPI000A2C0D70|nr:solute carrier family 12 member 8 [Parasteatoda tepidariorum]XP_042908667.1 solute carrier family 12 member 8 [Parasteatoda tepidariorum]XP_042908668.1 solute carrier family 12 member 8 [Parasteatoda tepidariorum]